MTINRWAFSPALAALAAAGAITAAPVASATNVDPGPLVAGPTEPAVNPAPLPGTSGTAAPHPGGPVAVFPQDQSIGGTDPDVPFGVWTP